MCFLDLSKAFDKVIHERLIQDLFALGVTGRPLRWLISYLSERTQRVCFGASSSTITSCSCGVPQGSVLGPLLFNVYTRDVPQVAQPAATIQFADDGRSIIVALTRLRLFPVRSPPQSPPWLHGWKSED